MAYIEQPFRLSNDGFPGRRKSPATDAANARVSKRGHWRDLRGDRGTAGKICGDIAIHYPVKLPKSIQLFGNFTSERTTFGYGVLLFLLYFFHGPNSRNSNVRRNRISFYHVRLLAGGIRDPLSPHQIWRWQRAKESLCHFSWRINPHLHYHHPLFCPNHILNHETL